MAFSRQAQRAAEAQRFQQVQKTVMMGLRHPELVGIEDLVREILTFLSCFYLFGKIQQLPNFGVASPGLRSKLLTFGLHLFARIV